MSYMGFDSVHDYFKHWKEGYKRHRDERIKKTKYPNRNKWKPARMRDDEDPIVKQFDKEIDQHRQYIKGWDRITDQKHY